GSSLYDWRCLACRNLVRTRLPFPRSASLYLVSHSPIASLHATCLGQIGFRREADRILRRCRLQPEFLIGPPAFFLTPWRIQGHKSLHSQGRRERLLRVGEPEPSLIQTLRSRDDQTSAHR